MLTALSKDPKGVGLYQHVLHLKRGRTQADASILSPLLSEPNLLLQPDHYQFIDEERQLLFSFF